ncbi:MAG: hypothetical protein BAJATHORv1_70107 [Candidatus Thorarchaeota archaeon]|nr:MAG: hypothetical protein BAJATHORv1_70107 [Candidatus Thorarchaeota archaeon]
MNHFDVVVVGGGPGGSSSSILCADEDLNVLLLEKGERDRHKACGGVLPAVAPDTIEDILDVEIPESVMQNPTRLGLYYVPPSGRKNRAVLDGYHIHNIDRDRFDQWLQDTAKKRGVDVQYHSKLVDFEHDQQFRIQIDTPSGKQIVTSDYLIGADGARSTTRQILFPEVEVPRMLVGQEEWRAGGDFGDYFYGFFRHDISKAYAYIIPKANRLLIGLGAVPHTEPNVNELLSRFKQWLTEEFGFRGLELFNREVWAIPFGYFYPGVGNALLVGDAAGLCNPLSGEGIRPAIESAEAAVFALVTDDETSLVERYSRNVAGLLAMIRELNEFVRGLDDDKMEEFVRQEAERSL